MLAKFRTRVSRALRLRHSTEARETACSAPELHWTVKSTAMGEDPFDYFQFLPVSLMAGVYFVMNSVKSSTMNIQNFRFQRATGILYGGD